MNQREKQNIKEYRQSHGGNGDVSLLEYIYLRASPASAGARQDRISSPQLYICVIQSYDAS